VKVRVLPSAWRELTEIEDWVTENFGGEFADRTNARLFKAFSLLADFPGMGRPRHDVTDHPVRFFHTGLFMNLDRRCSSIASSMLLAT